MPNGDDIFNVHIALFICGFAALQEGQWIFLPASLLIKYYHLHSVKLGKTTDGINDSPRIKQQLSKRKRKSL